MVCDSGLSDGATLAFERPDRLVLGGRARRRQDDRRCGHDLGRWTIRPNLGADPHREDKCKRGSSAACDHARHRPPAVKSLAHDPHRPNHLVEPGGTDDRRDRGDVVTKLPATRAAKAVRIKQAPLEKRQLAVRQQRRPDARALANRGSWFSRHMW